MSLFNGQFNGDRVINLGSRGLSRSSVLKKAKEEREKRKAVKEQERAAIVLQKHIRAYLDLKSQKYQEYEIWDNNCKNIKDINIFVRQFCFFNDVINKEETTYLRSSNKLMKRLELEIYELKPRNIEKLFNSLINYPFAGGSNVTSACIINILSLLAQQIMKQQLNLHLREGFLSSILYAQFNTDNQILNILEAVSRQNPLLALRVIFTSNEIGFLSNLDQIPYKECIKICLTNFNSTHENTLSKLDNNIEAEILTNMVQITKIFNENHNFEYSEICLNSIVIFLNNIDFQICDVDNFMDIDKQDDIDDSDSNNTDDEKYEAKNNTFIDKVVVESEQFNQLDYLYSKEFAKIFFNLINKDKIPITYLTTVFAALKRLRAGSDNEIYELIIYLYVLPNGFSSFKRLIFDEGGNDSKDPLYKKNLDNNKFLFSYISNLSEKKVLYAHTKFIEYFIPQPKKNNKLGIDLYLNEKFFKYDIFLFMEIMSFWLVIVTDSDIKQLSLMDEDTNQQFISMNEFRQFIKFLKNFAILLIQNTSKINNLFNSAKNGNPENRRSIFGNSNASSDIYKSTSNIFGSTSNIFENSNKMYTGNNNKNVFDISGSNISESKNSSNVFSNSSNNFFGNDAHNVEIQAKQSSLTQEEDGGEIYESKFQKIDFVSLKKLSLKILNMINLLDSRISFLPKDFWIVNDSRYDNIRKLAEELKKQEIINEINENSGNVEFDSMYTILNECPFFIPFHLRVEIFSALKQLDKEKIETGGFNVEYGLFFNLDHLKIKGSVRRDHILDDSMEIFSTPSIDLRHKLSLTFIDQYGNKEAGVDGGGLTKEFLTIVCQEGFKNVSSDLFKVNSNEQLYPNPNIYLTLKYLDSELRALNLRDKQINKLKRLEFLGQIIGKCLFEGILVDVEFVPVFLKKLKSFGNVSSFDELSDFDPELYNGLSQLLKLDDEFFEKSSDLTFSIIENVNIGLNNSSIKDSIKKTISINLIKNGDKIRVRNFNKMEFINAMTNFKLNKCLDLQTKYFMTGISKIIPLYRFKMFNPSELQTLISGGKSNLNIEDFKKNVVYSGYTEKDTTIQYFWEVIDEMSNDERCKLLKFVTSVPRAPLLGFSYLEPKFGIRNAFADSERIPTAATCFNLLKLPDYRDKKILRNKLLFAINSDAGFDLS